MARELKPCGTTAAYARHRRRYEDCAKCKAAKRAESQAIRKAVAAIRRGGRS